MREGATPPGMRRLPGRDKGGGTIYVVDDSPDRANVRERWTPTRNRSQMPCPTKPDTAIAKNWTAEIARLRGQMTPERRTKLAESTGIPADAWDKIGPGWATQADLRTYHASGAGWKDAYPDGAWAFPEYSGEGRVVGMSFRTADGRKGGPAGAKRGLIVPADLHKLAGPPLSVEGASDVAACCAMNVAAVGRPSNRAGAEDMALTLYGLGALVVGERDNKPGGAWPGRDGAIAVAKQLAGRWGEPVKWTLPPLDIKDVREWLKAKLSAGLNPADAGAMKAAGVELLAAFLESAKDAKPEKRTQADHLVDLANAEFWLGLSTDGEAFAVAREGPAVAIMFRGGAVGLRGMLAKRYRAMTGRTPSAGALGDALAALEGMAQDIPPEPLTLRVARQNGDVILDLGDPSGRVAVVTPAGWTIEAVSPVLFRRTALTSAMPEPIDTDAHELTELRTLLNVDDDSWPLLVGFLVAGLLADIPHPIAMWGGEQGTGKSTAARMLVELLDPSGAPLRSEPRDPEQWAIAAAGSWVVALDNVSRIAPWLSDALCKVCTGDGLVRRKLYSDSDLSVLNFRRVAMITSIEAGNLAGDLGDRLLKIDLERIPDSHRRCEAELGAEYAAIRPRLLGALLSALARTLAALPDVKLSAMPRMANFATILAALDTACPELTGGRAFELFRRQRELIAGEVVDGNPVASAVAGFMESRLEWDGTAGELLKALSPATPPKGWPGNAKALADRLKRVRPALTAVGIQHFPPAKGDKHRTHRLERIAPADAPPPEPTPGPAVAP